MEQQGLLGIALAVVGLAFALMRTHLAADPKPRPRLARWSAAGALACFFLASEILLCWFLPGICSGPWPFWIGGGVVFINFLVAVSLEARHMRRARIEAKQRTKEDDKRAIRIEAVAEQLREFIAELDLLFQQVMDRPPDPQQNLVEAMQWMSSLEGRANSLLIPWKRRVLDYLDATIGSDAVMQLHDLGSALDTAQSGAHAKSSHKEHRDFLEHLLVRVEQGKVRLKDPPESSGDLLPAVKSFVYRLGP